MRARSNHGEHLLQAQRRLRGQLLERTRSALPGAADLAAHMLVYLDDEARCWQLMLDWLRSTLDADRASGGRAGPHQRIHLVETESLRPGARLPSALGTTHDMGEAWARGALAGSAPLVFGDVASDPRFTPRRQRALLAQCTRTQLALVLRDADLPVGLVCCGWSEARPGWTPPLLDELGLVARAMLGPILRVASAAACAQGEDASAPAPHAAAAPHPLASLTPGELAVARLVVTGMSYKEIAERLNRSFSTVDHRLRAIREKLGARSTARMVALLAELLESAHAGAGGAQFHPGAVRPDFMQAQLLSPV